MAWPGRCMPILSAEAARWNSKTTRRWTFASDRARQWGRRNYGLKRRHGAQPQQLKRSSSVVNPSEGSRERIISAAPAFRIANQDAFFDQRQDIAQSSILRALCELGIFRSR